MRTRFAVLLLLMLPRFLVIATRTQESQALGDVGRRVREQQESAAGSGSTVPPQQQSSQKEGPPRHAAHAAEVQPQSGARPVTQMQLFAWLAGGLSSEDQINEVRVRGIGFEPDEACLHDLEAAGSDASLINALHTAPRRVSAAPKQNADSISEMAKVAIAVRKEDYRVALRLMTPLLQGDGNNPDLYLALGNIFNALEDWENARHSFARLVELAPQFPYAHGQLSFMYYQLGEGEKAEAEARAMLKLLPHSSDGHKFLGLALTAEDDDEGAFGEYAKALELNPNNALVYYNIGVLRAAQKDWEEAIVAYRRAIKIGPARWFFYHNLGVALGKLGRIDEAIKVFEKGREMAPHSPTLLQSYGTLLCQSGRDAQSVELFGKLLAARPDWNVVRPCLYRSLIRLGRAEEAKQVKEDYMKYSPDHSSW